MDGKMAWLQFIHSGSVMDYLHYRAIQQRENTPAQEAATNGSEYRRAGYQRAEYR